MPVKIRQNQALLSLSLTPLIDVVFQLLIFFLVATRFANEDRELDVPLPDASEARPITAVPRELFVNIDQQGQYFVGGRMVPLEQLEGILRQAQANNPANQFVRIHADWRVPFNAVVQAINLCKKVGIRDYVADTKAPDSR
ncbi:MAG: ExbD/TolR family protein [Pirellulaceae bacterium]